MRHLLPRRKELGIFAVIAVLCAAIVLRSGAHDLGLSLLSIPIFISAAMMGMRRHERLSAAHKPAPESAEAGERTA